MQSKVIPGLGDLATALSWPVALELREIYAKPCTEIEFSVSQGQQLTHQYTGAMHDLVVGGPGSVGEDGLTSVEACGFTANLPLDGLRLHAFDGMNNGIQFRRLDNCGVGDPAVFEMGFLDAVDIWSNVGSGYSVCFPEKGRIVFLDAATSPRTLMEIEYFIEDDRTCAAMDRAGTMVLVETADTTATPVESTRRPGH